MLIAITGGIGSGKSVVSQLLRVMGYYVYDCDARAKWVMTHDPALCQQLIDLFGPETYLAPQTLNKSYLSQQIFGNPEALARMNACVHPAVARDLQRQYTDYLSNFSNFSNHSNLSNLSVPSSSPILSTPSSPSTSSTPSTPTTPFFFESAILFESGFDKLSHPDRVWTVSAPLELRIERASMRDHATRQQILDRIQSQFPQEEKEKRSDVIIYNDPEHSVIEQVNFLMNNYL